MHRIFFIQEILFNIFGHCSPTPPDKSCHKADLAVLARTCRTFKEPALDVLWEELPNLSPLARCLPDVCCKPDGWRYAFSRPPSETEWNTLQGYTCRVWSIRGKYPDDALSEVLILAPPANPLFPSLRSLYWGCSTMLPVVHTAIPSLTMLHFNFQSSLSIPVVTEFLDAVGERCPNMKSFGVFSLPPDLINAISCQLRRWKNLQNVYCHQVSLSVDAILDLPSKSTLKRLWFTSSDDSHSTHHGSVLIFPDLVDLYIQSTSLKSIANLFSRIQLPAIKNLNVEISKYAPRRDVSAYWIAVQRACSSNTLKYLTLSSSDDGIDNLDRASPPWLTLNYLPSCRDLGNLCKIDINVAWPVKLTDTDLLDLVSTSPQLDELTINHRSGWRMDGNGGGITLNGLVQLLRQCPSLDRVSLAIDTRTFTRIPDGLDVSFPPRDGLILHILDSYIAHEVVADLKLTFKVLGVKWASPPMLGDLW